MTTIEDVRPGDKVRVTKVRGRNTAGEFRVIREGTVLRNDRGYISFEGDASVSVDRALTSLWEVEIEILKRALPTTAGSVIKAQCHAACASPPRLVFLGSSGTWRNEYGDQVYVGDQTVEIVFDAGAQA